MNVHQGHFLDNAEYDWTKPEAVEFYDIVVHAYRTSPDHILDTAGIDKSRINTRQSPRDIWREALEVAAASGRTRSLAQRARNDGGIRAYHARLDRLMGSSPAPAEAIVPAKTPIVWNWPEVITGKQPTFLDMSFLHQGLKFAAAVVRIVISSHDGSSSSATGFLIAPDTILTNYHVLYDGEGRPRRQADIWFNFELDAAGRPAVVDHYEGDIASIEGEKTHDWAIIRPKRSFNSAYPALPLRPSKPIQQGDFVYIIQHPGGGMKQIGLLHNEVVSVTQDLVHYLTDTLPGSSGSPVCNEFWQVIALHSQGIDDPTATGPTRKNQGILIDRVVERLTSRGILRPG